MPRISKISRFFTSRAVCTRLRGHRRGKSVNMSGRGSQDFMISQSHAICPQSKKSWYLWYWCLWFFLKCESICTLADFPASIYDKQTVAWRFGTINDIQRPLSLAQSLLKGEMTSIWRQRERTHLRLSRTAGLAYIYTKGLSNCRFLSQPLGSRSA